MKPHERELIIAAITFLIRDSNADISTILESLDFDDTETLNLITNAIYKAFGF